MSTKSNKELVGVLHNIRSLHNLGSVFRTADAAGVRKLYLTGYTPTPVDEFGRVIPFVHKTALGAEKCVPWEHVKNVSSLLSFLKEEGYTLFALEYTKDARDYRKYGVCFPAALIVGNEVRGLSPQILKKAHTTLKIPMRGSKESLNVGVAFGIAAYEMMR